MVDPYNNRMVFLPQVPTMTWRCADHLIPFRLPTNPDINLMQDLHRPYYTVGW